jgi:CRP-like cAMP-binding protein
VDEYQRIEKRTVVREDIETGEVEPKTTNVNIGPDGSAQVEEDVDVLDDPAGSTIIRQEETIEKHQR